MSKRNQMKHLFNQSNTNNGSSSRNFNNEHAPFPSEHPGGSAVNMRKTHRNYDKPQNDKAMKGKQLLSKVCSFELD